MTRPHRAVSSLIAHLALDYQRLKFDILLFSRCRRLVLLLCCDLVHPHRALRKGYLDPLGIKSFLEPGPQLALGGPLLGRFGL